MFLSFTHVNVIFISKQIRHLQTSCVFFYRYLCFDLNQFICCFYCYPYKWCSFLLEMFKLIIFLMRCTLYLKSSLYSLFSMSVHFLLELMCYLLSTFTEMTCAFFMIFPILNLKIVILSFFNNISNTDSWIFHMTLSLYIQFV